MDERTLGTFETLETKEWRGGLILTRSIGRSILASNGAVTTVLEVHRGRVKLGFKCPGLIVMRGEADPAEIRRKSTGIESEGFLIITRRIDQDVNIGNDMVVRVLEVERDRAKIGIKAPDDIKIMRAELLSPNELAVFNATNTLPAKLSPRQIS